MSTSPRPLDEHQQKLISIVKAAHQNLAIARKTKAQEYQRRASLMRAELEAELLRKIEEGNERIKLELDSEVVAHEAALDDALIASYNASIPVLRIAREGFGNRYPGGVQQLLVKLRTAGLIGSSEDYQRNSGDEVPATITFPEPIDVEATLSEATTIEKPTYTLLPEPLSLVPGEKEYDVLQVRLSMSPRDPWFGSIKGSARPGTPYLYATFCTLYLHPTTKELTVYESKEEGETFWDHPVARYVYTHMEEARAGYDAAIAVTAEDLKEVAELAEQLGIETPDA